MTAFYLRDNETYLSVSWLIAEHYVGIVGAVDHVRSKLRSIGYGLRKNGRFAVLNVSDVRSVLEGVLVQHIPEDYDSYHSGICGFTKNQEKVVALRLRMLVGNGDLYPGLV